MDQAWDVAVVGCGPIGAYAANLLGRSGLRTIVLDRERAPYALPRAVHIDHEMVRLLADIGLEREMLAQMRAGDGHIHIGADHGVIRYLSVTDEPRRFGYANDYFFYQPEFEQTLRRHLRRYPHVQLRLGTEVTALSEDREGVTLSVRDGEDIRARWVLACDGARSSVRRALGVNLDDLRFDEPWLVVDAEVDGPISFPSFTGVPAGANLQNLSLMMCDPRRPATIVPGRGNHRRWEFMLLPGEDDQEMARPEPVAALLAPWVRGAEHRIVRAATYRFHGLVAEHWRIGRTFLLGDSAHQTPPFFGQGMCHGMRDAANLAWKLVLVIAGKAGPDLLETYQVERNAQVRHVISAAIDAGRYICELDPLKAAERDRRMRGQPSIRSASELIAPIRSPLIGVGAGERFINPEVVPGGLLDAVTGGGWVLIETETHALTSEAEAILAALEAKRFGIGGHPGAADEVLSAWLAERQATAVLVRPDFYTALLAGNSEHLSGQLAALGAALSLTVLPTSAERLSAGA